MAAPDCKPCEICGNSIKGKPSYVAKRRFCSVRCRTAYQTGENNPHWRGGDVELICPQCRNGFLSTPAASCRRVYCSTQCHDASRAIVFSGENSYRWKGGRKAAKARYAAKRRAMRPRPVYRPPNIRCRQLKLIFKQTVRFCVKCGLPGVCKGCRYHPECSPYTSPGTRVIFRCVSCGSKREVTPAWAKARTRCLACEMRRRNGEGNSNWKGGITSVNQKIRASEEYRAWRLAVFKRDEYTCVWCGQVGGKLHADHIKPFADFPELRLVLSNGRTLCIECHKKTDSYLSKGKKKRQPAQLSLNLGD